MSDETRITHAPQRIFLNLGADLPAGDLDFRKLSDITWCEDRQGSGDLAYVREDAQSLASSSDVARHKRWATNEFLSRTGLLPTPRTMEALHATLDLFLSRVRGEEPVADPSAGAAPARPSTAR
jgi:hypothetical protein